MGERPGNELEKWGERFAAAGLLAIAIPLVLVAAALVVFVMAIHGY